MAGRKSPGRQHYLFAAVIVGGFLIWFLAGGWRIFDFWQPGQIRRLNSISNLLSGQTESWDVARFHGFSIGFDYYLKSPVVGHGLGAMHSLRALKGLGVHNTYLTVLGETGLPGIALFFGFLYSLSKHGYKAQQPWLRVFVLGYLVVLSTSFMTGHNILAHRNQNALTGICIGLLSLTSKR